MNSSGLSKLAGGELIVFGSLLVLPSLSTLASAHRRSCEGETLLPRTPPVRLRTRVTAQQKIVDTVPILPRFF